MNFKDRITIPRMIVFALLAVGPVVVIAEGIKFTSGSILFSIPLLLECFLLPLVVLFLLFLIVTSDQKLFVKILLVYGLFILFLVLIVLVGLLGSSESLKHWKNDEAAQPYAQVTDDSTLMPQLSNIGAPEKIDYYSYHAEHYIFAWDADILICKYNASDYESKKNAIDTEYIFQSEPMTIYEYTAEPTAEIDGYCFRVLSVNGEYKQEIYYPKKMMLIAINDTNHEIVYISFCDYDLDFITSLNDFINTYCGWKHIR